MLVACKMPRWLRLRLDLPTSAAAAAFLLLGILQFPGLFNGGFRWGEGFVEYIPMRIEAARILRGGDFPFFTDRLFGGMPLFSTGYVGVLYPPNWLYVVFPAGLANYLAAFHTLAGALGMMMYLRAHRLVPVAAFAGAVFFATSTFGLYHQDHVSMREAAFFAPWVAWAARRLLLKPGRARAAWFALLLAIQFFIGYPQIVLFTCVWIGLEWLAAVTPDRLGLRRTGWLAAGLIVGIGLAAVQILPALEHARQTPRAGLTIQDWQWSSFPPGHALLFVSPRAFSASFWTWKGHAFPGEIVITPNAAAWALALLCPLLALRSRLRRRAVAVWTIGVAGTLLLAAGWHFAPNALLFGVPPFNLFRIPARWLWLTGTLVSILAAISVQGLLHCRPRARWLLFLGGWFALGLAAWCLYYVFPAGIVAPKLHGLRALELLFADPKAEFDFLLAALMGFSLLAARRFPWITAITILAACGTSYLVLQNDALRPLERHGRITGTEEHPVLENHPPDSIQRLYLLSPGDETVRWEMLPHGTHLYRGYRGLGGYSPLWHDRMQDYLPLAQNGLTWENQALFANPAPLSELAVSHLIVSAAGMDQEQLATWNRLKNGVAYDLIEWNDNLALVELANAPPRVHFVERWHRAPDKEAVIRDLWTPWPPRAQRPVLLIAPPEGFLPEDTPLAMGSIEPLEWSPNVQRFRVKTPGDGLIVVHDTSWKGWKYRYHFPGGEVSPYRDAVPVHALSRGIRTVAGEYVVEVKYFPPGFYSGLAITGLAMLLCGSFFLGRPKMRCR